MILNKVKCRECGGTLRVHGYHTKINRNENLEVTMTVDPCRTCMTTEYCKGSNDGARATEIAVDKVSQ